MLQAGKSQGKYPKHRVYTNEQHKTLITGMVQHKNNVICTGVVGLASPAARTINYNWAYFMLMNTLNDFIATMLNYQTITWKENLDSTLKRSYPFVTPSISYTWSLMALRFENVNLFLHKRRPFWG